MDYPLTLPGVEGDYIFISDTTYHLVGNFSVSGTTTLEGGTVIKYNSGTVLSLNEVICKADLYRPVILTSKDDNSVGETAQGSTGNPQISAGEALSLNAECEINNFHIRYAATGVSGYNPFAIRNSQFVHCGTAVYCENSSFGAHNILMHDVLFGFYGCAYYAHVEHLTLCQAQVVAADFWNGVDCDGEPDSWFEIFNSIIVGNASYGSSLPVDEIEVEHPSSVAGTFIGTGAGQYYLANATFRDRGIDWIDEASKKDLALRTTHPPIPIATQTISANHTFARQSTVKRDVDTPDLGYHYAPLDYLLIGDVAVANATLKLEGGVRIGVTSGADQCGIVLHNGGRLIAEASPMDMNYIVRYNTVQEQPSAGTTGIGGLIGTALSSRSGEIQLRSTALCGQHDLLSSQGLLNVSFTDCQFYSGKLSVQGYYPDLGAWQVKNCLFNRIRFPMGFMAVCASFYNNTFDGGVLELDIYGGSSFTFRDNLFYRTGLMDFGAPLDRDYNFYINGYGWSCNWTPTVNDVILNSLTYYPGPLGRYYYDEANLLNKGSRSAADAGLYHYTVLPSQQKAGVLGDGRVSFGKHYIALDPNTGLPFDSDGDGIPDHIEDANGNGYWDDGETDWRPAPPVVSISSSAPEAYKIAGNASFTITRAIGEGATLNNPLTVYYVVGGTAVYNTDYTLRDDLNNPPGGGPPGVFSTIIRAGQASVTITATPIGFRLSQAGTQTINIELTHFEPASFYIIDDYGSTVVLAIHNGVLVNLEKTTEGYLRIKPTAETTPLPFVNLANSGRGTVTRIEVPNPSNLSLKNPKIVGEYFTAPTTRGDPSRTTVDRYGNVWVGNRAEGDANGGSIAQIGVVMGGTRGTRTPATGTPFTFTPDPPDVAVPGEWLAPPFIYNTCIDRDGDQLIRSSSGLATSGDTSKILAWDDPSADTLGGVSKALDEAILRYVRVSPTFVRSVAVDGKNNVWIGGYGNGLQEYIDGITGLPITGHTVQFGCGGYGGLVDGHGTLWSAGYRAGGLLRFVPNGVQPPGVEGGVIPNTYSGYGIGIDPKTGDVWLGDYQKGSVLRLREAACPEVYPIQAEAPIRGVVVDGNENVWIANSGGTVVYHLLTTGEIVGQVSVAEVNGNFPYGLCVDSSGMIWAICHNGYAVRIDPKRNPASDPSHSPPIGVATESVYLGTSAAPYNYSDMSGFVTLSTTKPAGFWDFVQDSATDNTRWTRVPTIANTTPSSSQVLVEVRAANSITELPSWPFQLVLPDGAIPSGIKGRYLEVRVTLLRDFCAGGTCAGPELRSLAVEFDGQASTLQFLSHPKNQTKAPGQTVRFEVSVSLPSGVTADYQWRKDGVDLVNDAKFSGANSPSLDVFDVQYTEAGRYSLRVTDSTGTILESAEARLHIKGDAPSPAGDPWSTITDPGESVTFRADAIATPSGVGDAGNEPIFFQWRHGQNPIGTATQCAQDSDRWLAELSLSDVQDGGEYSVVFYNRYGAVLSKSAQLTVSGRQPVSIEATLDGVPNDLPVVVQHQAQTVTLNANIRFPLTCAGQWYVTPLGGVKTRILGAIGLSYTIPPPITCDELGTYTFKIYDRSAWDWREATAEVTAWPEVSMASITLELNATVNNIESYKYLESPDGVSWSEYKGEKGQNWLKVDTDDGTKSFYRYRIEALQEDTVVASVTGSLDDSRARWPSFRVLDVQNGTADVRLTASPSGIGPWTYQWSRNNNPSQLIPGATGNSYEISGVDCGKQVMYQIQANDSCGGSATMTASLLTPLEVLMGSVTVELNSTASNIERYKFFKSSDGVSWDDYTGQTGQNWLKIETDGTGSPYYYRIEALLQDETVVASVQWFLQDSAPVQILPKLCLMSVLGGTADVTFTAAKPIGVGPWVYQWSRYNSETGAYDPIPGASSVSHQINAVDSGNEGVYQLEATDDCGDIGTTSASFYFH